MGLRVLKNKEGLYKLTSTVTDEDHHEEEWITENEAKKILIEKAYWDFLSDMVQIDMEFPHGYGSMEDGRFIDKNKAGSGSQWMLDNYKTESPVKTLNDKIDEIKARLNITFEVEE